MANNSDSSWVDTLLDSVWDEACDMMEDGGTADITRTLAKQKILQKMNEAYKNGFYAASGMAGLELEQTHYSWDMFQAGSKDPKNIKEAIKRTQLKSLEPTTPINGEEKHE